MHKDIKIIYLKKTKEKEIKTKNTKYANIRPYQNEIKNEKRKLKVL